MTKNGSHETVAKCLRVRQISDIMASSSLPLCRPSWSTLGVITVILETGLILLLTREGSIMTMGKFYTLIASH